MFFYVIWFCVWAATLLMLLIITLGMLHCWGQRFIQLHYWGCSDVLLWKHSSVRRWWRSGCRDYWNYSFGYFRLPKRWGLKKKLTVSIDCLEFILEFLIDYYYSFLMLRLFVYLLWFLLGLNCSCLFPCLCLLSCQTSCESRGAHAWWRFPKSCFGEIRSQCH